MDMFSALIASFRQIAETGGPVVVVLMGVAVLTLAVAIYKVWQFWRSAVGRHKALTEAVEAWDRGDRPAAREALGRSKSYLAPVIKMAMVSNGKGSGAGQDLVDAVDLGMVNKISFTGSTPVGKMIGEICGRNLVSASLELGGKNPLVIMPSANLENAVEGAYWAGFGTAGQRCTSLGNLIIHEDIYDEFVERLMAKVKATAVGDSMRHDGVLYGSMLSEKYSTDFLKGIEMCDASGATKLWGKGRITNDNKPENFQGDASEGVYMWPHVYADVTEDMDCFQEEIFGPVITIVKASDFEHALHLANASPYGLSSAIYTNDRLEAYRYKTGIKAGMTGINNSTTGAEAHLPFGGVKGSGNGTRESGIWVIEAYSYWHAVNDELSGKLQLAQMDVEEIELEEADADYAGLA